MIPKLVSITFFSILISCANTQDFVQEFPSDQDSIVALLSYGLKDWEYEREIAIDIFSKKYSLKFVTIAGCVVTNEFEDSVENLNEISDSIITKVNGLNWKESFYRGIDSLDSCIHRTEYIANKQFFIKEKNEEFRNEIKGRKPPFPTLNFFVEPLKSANLYLLEAYTVKEKNQLISAIIHFRILVDLETESVQILDNDIDTCDFFSMYMPNIYK